MEEVKNDVMFNMAKVNAVMYAMEQAYIVAPLDENKAEMACMMFYALRDCLKELENSLEHSFGNAM